MIYCLDYESLIVSFKDFDFWKLLLREVIIRNYMLLFDLVESIKEGENFFSQLLQEMLKFFYNEVRISESFLNNSNFGRD